MLRKERRMTAAEVAAGMGIAVRTYQDFEAGKGDLDLNKILLFATATGTDAVSIILALLFRDPDLARQSMDNKLPTTFWISFREFRDDVGEQLNVVPPALLLEGFRRVYEEIRLYLRKRADSAEDWLERAIAEAYRPPDDNETDDQA
ncbi:helix-turn-helix transcriptional regulator [Caulobacter sp. SSI4214]|uniref:helix-turn-helix domain-containing protein n=1 Tax=Caulobacter sp. SSI4214 TaxID=2575739 RepID=UPI0023AB107C|nr:helix-turn-helix transcriptional regulator [Caulobacter sp. SSI4214]